MIPIPLVVTEEEFDALTVMMQRGGFGTPTSLLHSALVMYGRQYLGLDIPSDLFPLKRKKDVPVCA